jgi:hypothetical protein
MNLRQLYAEIEGVYTPQHLALLSRLKKIPDAQFEGRRWAYAETPKLRRWVRKALEKARNTAKRQTFNSAPPSVPTALKASEIAKLCGLGKRQIERLAHTRLKSWHHFSSGGHHRFKRERGLLKCIRELKGEQLRRSLPKPSGYGKQTRHEERSPFQSLIKFAGEMQACLTGWRREKPVSDWSPELRDQVKSQLEPIVRFYQTL